MSVAILQEIEDAERRAARQIDYQKIKVIHQLENWQRLCQRRCRFGSCQNASANKRKGWRRAKKVGTSYMEIRLIKLAKRENFISALHIAKVEFLHLKFKIGKRKKIFFSASLNWH